MQLTYDECLSQALYYAWGYGDASGVPTYQPAGSVSGQWAFAEAYAKMRASNASHMPSIQQAYGIWQETKGESVTKG